MTLVDAMLRACKYYMDNLSEIVVNRIRSQYRHDLKIENGSGASILLTGSQVLINGLSGGTGGGNVFEIIYIGSDQTAWITRDPDNGNLVIHIPANKQLQFERGS